MTSGKIRGLGAGLLVGACAGLLDVAALLNAAPALADDAAPIDYTALVLGHAFLSTPDATYENEVIGTYVDPSPPYFSGQPVYDVGNTIGVTTPETDYSSGLTEGVADLDSAIRPLLAANPDADLVVFGYSMSTSIETQEMLNLASQGVSDPNLNFVLAEDLQTPDGGFFTRFPDYAGANLPATPADTPYTTDIYSIEYSGASDFPEYDGNTFADLNAADGYIDLHPYLLPGWPAYFTPSELAGAVDEGTSGNTTYYLIPTQDLPILNDLRDAPGAPSALADMIQPDMRVLVDLGYDWTGDPSVATPATMSNPDIDMTAVDAYLAAGADQGMIAYLVDLNILPQSDLTSLADLYPYVPDIADLQAGALSSGTVAASGITPALDASESASLLTSDLADSTNPIAVDFGSYFPGMATDLADYFQNLASFL